MSEAAPIVTQHAMQRCAQRNYHSEDLALILRYGTSTKAGILMTKKDAREAQNDLRMELRRLEQMRRAA